MSTDALCSGLPNEFAIYVNYARSLKLNDKLDYSYLRIIFHDLYVREEYRYIDTLDNL